MNTSQTTRPARNPDTNGPGPTDYEKWADEPDKSGAENWHRSVRFWTLEPGLHFLTVFVGSDAKNTQAVAVATATDTRLCHATTNLPSCKQTQTVHMVIEDTLLHLSDLWPKLSSKEDGAHVTLGEITVYQPTAESEGTVAYQYGFFNKRDPLHSKPLVQKRGQI